MYINFLPSTQPQHLVNLRLPTRLIRMKVIITVIRVREPMSLIPRHQFILVRPEMNRRPIRECLGHIGSQYAGADSIALAFISKRNVINVEIVTVSLVIGSDDEA